jgi:hypothetical protein
MAQEPPWIDLMSNSTVKSLRKFFAVNTGVARRPDAVRDHQGRVAVYPTEL